MENTQTVETLLSLLVISIVALFLVLRIIPLKDWKHYANEALVKYDFVADKYVWYKEIYPNMAEHVIFFHIKRDLEEELEKGYLGIYSPRDYHDAIYLLHMVHKRALK